MNNCTGLMLGAADLLHSVKLEYNVEYLGTYEVSNSSVQYHSALHFRVLQKSAQEHVPVDHFMGHYDDSDRRKNSPENEKNPGITIKVTKESPPPPPSPDKTTLVLDDMHKSNSLQDPHERAGAMQRIEQVEITKDSQIQTETGNDLTEGDRNQNMSIFKASNFNFPLENQEEVQIAESFKMPTISLHSCCSLLPYHIVIDKGLKIKQSGDMLRRFFPHIKAGAYFNNTCFIRYPRMPFTFEALRDFEKTCFVVGIHEAKQAFSLKGQMVPLQGSHVMFVCSPVLRTLTELEEKEVYICDLPIYDMTREFVLLNQLRQAEIGISLTLEETTAALQKMAAELETEKAKTDMLLNEMLPARVVKQLQEGKRVEAEKYEVSTILFSDIVTFTNIAAAVTPMDVVDLLNHLYSLFDSLTSKHGVYKVETIGDAYMVVGGVPDPDILHADSVARMALDMQKAAASCTSPLTGFPIQIRVGIHTGSVVAGVVGDKMPRYCLFGDTVNTASRMESHGLPGKIHVSPDTNKYLSEAGFGLEPRGVVKIKGKGKMTTYFLLSSPVNDKDSRPPSRFSQLALGKGVVKSGFCQIL